MTHSHTTADYDRVAHIYAGHRSAVPWKVVALAKAFHNDKHALTIEVGCGTGDYLEALAIRFPGARFFGFDISLGMLKAAAARQLSFRAAVACAEEGWPFRTQTSDFVFSVDVMQHLTNFTSFFQEAGRVLRRGGALAIVTDSEEDIRRRSLAKLFPETVPVNLARYPTVDHLAKTASRAGMELLAQNNCSGYLNLSEQFVASLQEKALSELRLISPDAHNSGMLRAHAARRAGEKWLSSTTILVFGHKAA